MTENSHAGGMQDIRGPVLRQLAAFHAAGPSGQVGGPAAWLSAVPAAKSWTQLELLTALAFTADVFLTLAQAVDATNEIEGVWVDPAAHIQHYLALLAEEEDGQDSD